MAMTEEMATLRAASLGGAGELASQRLHQPTDGHSVDLDGHVNRVREPAVCVQPGARAMQGGAEQALEANVVVAAAEDCAPRRARLHDVVSPAWMCRRPGRDMATSLCSRRRIRLKSRQSLNGGL